MQSSVFSEARTNARMRLAETIVKLRTQREISKRLSPRTYCAWEKGKGSPELYDLERIAAIFQVPLHVVILLECPCCGGTRQKA